jgi:phosphoserine phosphatase
LRVIIARLIADGERLSAGLDGALAALNAAGMAAAEAGLIESGGRVLELALPHGDRAAVRAILDEHFAPSDCLIADDEPQVPHVFVSDMDSTMIAAECIDELADFAGLKAEVAAITERAMQGERAFAGALTERVVLLGGLGEDAIATCLAERVPLMPGARTLVQTLKARGCRTVLVTGGFHQFADPIAEQLGFERVVANRLATGAGRLTGGLIGPITDAATKRQVLVEEAARIGDHAVSLATGDGANDVPMLQAATYGLAYRAKPKAREAASGWLDHGDLTAVLELLGIPRRDWIY